MRKLPDKIADDCRTCPYLQHFGKQAENNTWKFGCGPLIIRNMMYKERDDVTEMTSAYINVPDDKFDDPAYWKPHESCPLVKA